MLSYILLILAILLFLNSYPIIVSRDLVFSTKETIMSNQSTMIGTTIESLDTLNADSVTQIIGMLDTGSLDGLIVINADGERLYDETAEIPPDDQDLILWGVDRVLAGNDVFYSVFSGKVFSSIALTPIMNGDNVTGAVYIYERDDSQGAIINGLRTNLMRISFAIFVFSILISIIFSKTFTDRLKKILEAIKSVRAGEYTYRIDSKGRDELAQLCGEFNNLTDRLQQTEAARRQFVADASHELKTPLASIRLLSDSILQNESIDACTIREFVADIGNESERLARITEKLLNLTKHDNQIHAVWKPVDTGKILQDTLRVLAPLAKETGVTLHTQTESDCFVLASDDDIYQVMLNLSENAIKYNKPQGHVYISLYEENDTVIFKVEDTGIGIPENDLPKIFDRFYRVDKARSREAGGSGLGLSIVQTIVTEHGGTVSAENRTDGGMCFTVVWPVYTDTHEVYE